jgi:trimeric autotransporter adhesin
VVGCGHHATPATFCSAGDSGPVVGQVATIVLAPNFATTGESLNYGQKGATLSATAFDCKGGTVSVRSYTYASTSSYNVNLPGGPVFADINPASGQVCGGTWNRNVGGGIPDYTTCNPPPTPPTQFLAYVTATANGAVSNAIPVYVHPVVTGIILGGATGIVPGTTCPTATSAGTDPGTDCSLCSPSTVGTPVVAPPYNPLTCLSQSHTGQLVARVYDSSVVCPGGGTICAANNITCKVGHVSLAAQSGNIATIDETGVATANQPGSTVITATVSNSSTGTQAGFLSTCPPANIALSIPGQPGVDSITVGINNAQPLIATVTDTNHNPITGIALTYNSTTPQTVFPGIATVTPLYPGSADITAVCLPSTCNPAPFSQIGYLGNGKPITSNPITVSAVGTSSTVIYMGSTQSLYLQEHDFTTNQPGALIKLPYVPNSMVINQLGTNVYLGSSEGLMSFSTANNLLAAVNQGLPGVVLAVSPDGNTLVITDPARQTIALVTGSGGAVAIYGGVGTHAQWSPDSQTVYITTSTGEILTHSSFTDWQSATDAAEPYTDVAVTVPHLGAYFAGAVSTDGRSYCSQSTIENSGTPPPVSNTFIPLADSSPAMTDRIAATTDGKHMIGAHLNTDGTSTLNDILLDLPTGPCPIPNPQTPGVPSTPVKFSSSRTFYPLTGVKATEIDKVSTPAQAPMAITGVYTSSNSLAAFASYTGSGGVLPFYAIPSSGVGKLQMLPLSGGAVAPVSGVFSTDNLSFYTGTMGDNAVHIITLTYPTGALPTATETPGAVITPNLPNNVTGAISSPVNLIVQHPKKSTD